MRRILTIRFFGVAMALLAAYVGMYFATVKNLFVSGVGWATCSPYYRGIPPIVFAPIHYLDRTWLRPSRWSYSLIIPTPPVERSETDAATTTKTPPK